jgi:hypothetical protein
MTSQTAIGSVFHTSTTDRDAAQRIVDTYIDQRDHEDLAPAFDDIVFAESQQTGIDDDTLYAYARELLVAQTGELIEDPA